MSYDPRRMARITADAVYTDAELLELTREAIAQLVGGAQRYKIGGREYEAADLPELRRSVEWLEARLARSRAGGGLSFRNVRLGRRT